MADDLRLRNAHHEGGHAAAALVYGIPIISAMIEGEMPYVHRGKYDSRLDLALETIIVFCPSGGAAEELYCGPITDDADRLDIAMARGFLAKEFEALWLGVSSNACTRVLAVWCARRR